MSHVINLSYICLLIIRSILFGTFYFISISIVLSASLVGIKRFSIRRLTQGLVVNFPNFGRSSVLKAS